MVSCADFRDQWLELALDVQAAESLAKESEHLAGCTLCAGWLRSVNPQVRALVAMKPVPIPEEMEEAIEDHLARPALERALRSLPRLEVPAELDARVEFELSDPEKTRELMGESEPANSERALKSIRTLDYPTVPNVLERLLSEELADPAAHRVERFVGNLEQMTAPAELDRMVARRLRRPFPIRLAGVASLAAALLIGWFVFPRTQEPEERRLRVVHVQDISDLDPVARGFVQGLHGGVTAGGVR